MAQATKGGQILGRLRAALPDAAAATVAAALSWFIARALFGHPQPLFAAIAAIVCLSPGLPNHGRQAVGLVLGVATGIAVGEAALLVPDAFAALRLGLATFVAIMIASAYGLLPVVPIQSGVSAILVLAIGADTAGAVRLLDVACGTAVGLIFSQVLFTPDPVKALREAERTLLDAIGDAFGYAEKALAANDQAGAQMALKRFSDAHADLVVLAGGIDTARSTASWSLRGRLIRRDLRAVAGQFERRSTRTYAAALLFGTALATAMQRRPGPAPRTLAPAIALAIDFCDLDRPMPSPILLPLEGIHDDWRRCLVRLDEAIAAIQALREAEIFG